MLDKRIKLTSWNFELDNGILKYKEKEIKDIEKEIEKMSNEQIKHFQYFLENYNREVEKLEKNKLKVKNLLQNKTENLNVSWKKLNDLRKKEANEIKKETIRVLTKLDKELENNGKWNWANICTMEFFDSEKPNDVGNERIILKWNDKKGYNFIAQKIVWDKNCVIWEDKEDLYYLDEQWEKYKNLEIEKITNKMAEKIAKKLPKRLIELTEDYQEDILNKKMILMELRLLS